MTASTTTRNLTPQAIPAYCADLASRARAAGRALSLITSDRRNRALNLIADAIESAQAEIIAANAKDLDAAKDMGLTDAMLERLALTPTRIAGMAMSVRQIALQTDPVGQILDGYTLPNGIRLQKVRVPLGVIFFIYESRPNVTTDAAALSLKSGNAVILRGGKEAIHSNTLTTRLVREALAKADLPDDAAQLVETTDRAAVGELLQLEAQIDIVIPRGGHSLIKAVVEQSRIPVIKHYTGNCHVYVDNPCDAAMAEKIVINAKTQRPSVCNAAETLLFHKDHLTTGLVKKIGAALVAKGVELRADEVAAAELPGSKPATPEDWDTEYTDLILTVGIVDDVTAAIDHINKHGSGHTDAIVTTNMAAADAFVAAVDSGNVFVNCSTRFSDGGEYGLGAEIGISTDKLHARGPMGAADMTTYKWVARGNGQVRG